jgi:hypothetical protein
LNDTTPFIAVPVLYRRRNVNDGCGPPANVGKKRKVARAMKAAGPSKLNNRSSKHDAIEA